MHAHDHSHNAPNANRQALKTAFWITAGFMAVEFVAGWFTGSLALMADAGHMLTDTTALGFSLLASRLAERPADDRRTWGHTRWEILAAFINGFALLILVGLILWRAIERLGQPTHVHAGPMLGVAIIGLIINLFAAKKLHSVEDPNLNVRVAYLHVMSDLLGSVGAIAAGLLMMFTGNYLFDPIVSIMIGVLVLYSAQNLVRESFHILLEGTPTHLSPTEIREALAALPEVQVVHDLHIWTIGSGYTALSAHLVVEQSSLHDTGAVLQRANQLLNERFKIAHTTLQVEPPGQSCHDCET